MEVTNGVGRDVWIEPVGLREHDVEADHDGAEAGQISNQIRDPRPWPRPLAEFRQALLVDIDNGDRPCGLHPGIDELEGVEGSDPKLLDRGRIGDPEGRKADQERQAHQPGIPEPSREPPSQYPQPLHGFSDVSFNWICQDAANWGRSSSNPARPEAVFYLIGVQQQMPTA